MCKIARVVLTFVVLAIFMASLVACRGGANTILPTEPSMQGKIKVGLSFSDFALDRWRTEEAMLRLVLEGRGYEVISQQADHDVKRQNDQINDMVSQGVRALIVVAEDGESIVPAVDKAADAGVKVVAYDRLIKTSKIAAYLSFDNVEVGRQQARGVMKAMGADTWDVAKNGKMRVIQLAGSPTDNNAKLFTKGQTEILQPYIDKGIVEIIAQHGVDNWDFDKATLVMDKLLTDARDDVDAIVASNDSTALGALKAMKAHGMAGKVPISGQDATADGVNSIAKGELTVSILKDIRQLSPLAVDIIDQLLKDQFVTNAKYFKLSELTVDPSKSGEVLCVFLPVQQVDKENVYDLVVKTGYQPYETVYRDVPEDQRPPEQ
jgi:D-xylose transport system substrate-binding protein